MFSDFHLTCQACVRRSSATLPATASGGFDFFIVVPCSYFWERHCPSSTCATCFSLLTLNHQSFENIQTNIERTYRWFFSCYFSKCLVDVHQATLPHSTKFVLKVGYLAGTDCFSGIRFRDFIMLTHDSILDRGLQTRFVSHGLNSMVRTETVFFLCAALYAVAHALRRCSLWLGSLFKKWWTTCGKTTPQNKNEELKELETVHWWTFFTEN